MKIEYINVFGNLNYPNLLELAKESYLYPNRFFKFYNSNKFQAILKNTSQEKYEKFLEIKNANYIQEVFTFKVSYLLNPYMSLRYQHFKFDNYVQLAETMLNYAPSIDVYLKDLLIYHLLSEYMENTGDFKMYPKIYKSVKDAEKQLVSNQNIAYWNLAFDISKKENLIYDGKEFKTPFEFFQYVLAIYDLFKFSSSFLDDCYVLTWLERKGYSYIVSRFISLCRLTDQIDTKTRIQLADQLLIDLKKEHEQYRNFVCNHKYIQFVEIVSCVKVIDHFYLQQIY